jgi:hypothetical protein
MFPIMIFAIAAFRPERDPPLIHLLDDVGWLIITPACPTFVARFLGIAPATLRDTGQRPVYPRWTAYFFLWLLVVTWLTIAAIDTEPSTG